MTDNLSPVEIDSDDDEQLRAHPMLKEFCKKNKKRGERDGEQQRKESKNSENRSVSLTINTAGNMKITRDEVIFLKLLLVIFLCFNLCLCCICKTY